MDDANAVVGERGMHVWELHSRHVAGDAILRRSGAGFTGVAGRGLLRARRGVAREALLVIRGGITVEGLVRVVASGASEARVPFAPATAALEAIRLKAHVLHARDFRFTNFEPGAVAGAAKIDLRDRP